MAGICNIFPVMWNFYYRHPDKLGGRICIQMHAGEIIAPKLLKGILEDAGLSVEEFIKLLKR